MRFVAALALVSILLNPALAQKKKGKQKPETVIEIDPWGRPQKKGPQEALLLWQDSAGWHIRSLAGARNAAHFAGAIHVVNGKVMRLAAGGLEATGPGRDIGQVSQDGKTITFKFETLNGGEDGFDFTLTRNATEIQVAAAFEKFDHPERILIGANGSSAPGAKFSLPVKATE